MKILSLITHPHAEEGEVLLTTVVILVFFAHKKYSQYFS